MSYIPQHIPLHLHHKDGGYKLLWDTEVSARTTQKQSMLPQESKNFLWQH
jgi:hypothetical protein